MLAVRKLVTTTTPWACGHRVGSRVRYRKMFGLGREDWGEVRVFFFFYIVFRVTGIYARLWILSTWNKKLLPHTSEQKWEESVKPTLRYGLCQTKTATSLRGNAEACRFTHFECYLLHSGSQPRKCRKNFGLWRDKVRYAENILRI